MHWLNRLLNPNSIALIGASAKQGSIGSNTLRILQETGYRGSIYPVNPRYRSVEGKACFKRISDLPEVPDLAVFAVGGLALEQSFNDAIDKGVGGAVIYANNYIADDTTPPLLERLRNKAAQADIPVCGGNGMGFQNYDTNTLVSFDRPPKRSSGHVALIAHSGSVMTYLANNDPRFTYNLVVSSGQEINGTFVDYMDYALDQPTTRVIALFVEAVRDPEGFVKALAKARNKDVPVVIVKVGRNEQSARFAKSHSGAIAGDDQAFQAVCDCHGAIRVRDIDELANTAYLLSQTRRPSAGGLASVTDSGGLREQLIDLAEDTGVAFAQISEPTRDRLAANLEHGLEPENPLDAMGALNADVGPIFHECLTALLNDPDTALLSFEFEFRDDFSHYPVLMDVIKTVWSHTSKPVVVVNSFSSSSNTAKAGELSRLGIPVINGVDLALKAIKSAFLYRDNRNKPRDAPGSAEPCTVSLWQKKLASASAIGETMAMEMLSDFGLPVVQHSVADSLESALLKAEHLGYPVAMKSAQSGLMHKTEVDGVKLALRDGADVEEAYREMSKRLGNQVVVAPMVQVGIEVAFGMIRDPQFGPIIMIGAGGVHVELLDDRCFALAPFGQGQAREMLDSLKIAKLLKGVRNRSPCDIDQLALALSRFSVMAFSLSDCIREIDINPIIAHSSGCVVVDALVVAHELSN